MRLVSFAMALAMGLAASSSIASSSGAVQAGGASPAAVPAEDWGVLARFAGKDLVCTCDPKRIWLLRRDATSNALRIVARNEYGTNVTLFRLDADGRGVADMYWAETAEGGTLVPMLEGGKSGGADLTPAKFDLPWRLDADGAVVLNSGTERRPYRARYRIAGERLILETARATDWTLKMEMREIGASDVEAGRLAAALRQYVGSPSVASVSSAGSVPGSVQPDAAGETLRTIQDGAFDPEGLDEALSRMLVLALAQEGQNIRVAFSGSRHVYRPMSDGTFAAVDDATNRMKVIDAQTVELFSSNHPDRSRRFLRRNGAGEQPRELRFGMYEVVGQDPRSPLKVLQLAGNTLHLAEPMGVSDFVLKADGKYHDPSTNVTLRIIDLYTVEWAPPHSNPHDRLLLTRLADAAPDYVEVSRRKLDQWMAQYEADNYEAMRAEEEAWQAHLDSVDNMTPSGTGVGNVMEAFMRGFGEATQSNQAMQQSMENARDRGLAEGALEFARREAERARQATAQRQADVEHARRVREAEEAARIARASSQAGGSGSAGLVIEGSGSPTAASRGAGSDGGGSTPRPVGIKPPEPVTLPAPNPPQCHVETTTELARSIPIADRAAAESHVRNQHCARGDLRPVSLGPISCTSESEPILERGRPNGVRVTGHRTMYTCEAARTCRVEVCEAPPPSTGATAQ